MTVGTGERAGWSFWIWVAAALAGLPVGDFQQSVSGCRDGNQNCSTWADLGYCLTFPMTMATETCLLSCNWCSGFQGSAGCVDLDNDCVLRALRDGCDSPSMVKDCPESCALCKYSPVQLPDVSGCADYYSDCAQRVDREPLACRNYTNTNTSNTTDSSTTSWVYFCQATCGNCQACANLTEVANGNIRYNGAEPAYPFPKRGDTVTWVCEAGYRHVGGASGRRVCADNGTWIISATDSAPPVCQKITSCDEPPPVANAYRHVESFRVGTNVTYTCYQGYKMTSGNALRTCNNLTGEYTGLSPVCSPVCPKPAMPGVVFDVTSRFSDGSTATAFCSSDNQFDSGGITAPPVVTCDVATRLWNMSTVWCEERVPLHSAEQSQTFRDRVAQLAIDADPSSCAASPANYSHRWEVAFGSVSNAAGKDLYYVSRVIVDMPFQTPGMAEAEVTVEILGKNLSYCATTTTVWTSDSLALWCEQLEGQYPLGHALRITTTFPSRPQELRVCNVSVWGQVKIDYCPAAPEIAGLKLYDPSSQQVGRSAVDYYTDNTILRYVCDGDKTPLGGEDLAMCDVTVGTWTEPTLICTGQSSLADQQPVTQDSQWAELPAKSVGMTALTDGNDHTCGVLPHDSTQPMMLHVPLASQLVEVDMVSVVVSRATCPEVVSASVTTYKNGTTFKRCTSFQAEVTYNLTKVTLTCAQRPLATQPTVEVLVDCVGSYNLIEACEVRVFGRQSGLALECYRSPRGQDYKGRLSVSKGGHSCRPWNSRTRSFRTEDFPDYSLEEAGNFCRNPDNSRHGLWCYIDDYRTRDTCLIPACDAVCRVDEKGENYQGATERTNEGKKCERWSSAGLPFLRAEDFPDGSLDHNSCRNPGGSQTVPWCYIHVEPLEYQHCHVTFCPTEIVVFDAYLPPLWTSGRCFQQVSPGGVPLSVFTLSPLNVVGSSFAQVLCSDGLRAFMCLADLVPRQLLLIHLDCDPVTTTSPVTTYNIQPTPSSAYSNDITSPSDVSNYDVTISSSAAETTGTGSSTDGGIATATTGDTYTAASTATAFTDVGFQTVPPTLGQHPTATTSDPGLGAESPTPTLVHHPTATTAIEIGSTLSSYPRSSSQQQCCACACRQSPPAPTSLPDPAQVAGSLRANLTLDRRSISGYSRKRTSAYDSRASAAAIGVLGLVFLISFLALFLVSDILAVSAFLWGLLCRSGGGRSDNGCK